MHSGVWKHHMPYFRYIMWSIRLWRGFMHGDKLSSGGRSNIQKLMWGLCILGFIHLCFLLIETSSQIHPEVATNFQKSIANKNPLKKSVFLGRHFKASLRSLAKFCCLWKIDFFFLGNLSLLFCSNLFDIGFIAQKEHLPLQTMLHFATT